MTERRAHLRIGIDTGGTFTDIVCGRWRHRARCASPRSPSTPANPAHRSGARRQGDPRCRSARSVDDLAGLAHGTTVATNALLQGEIDWLGLIVTEGFRHILEIARQAVPEGYGNSYFWVKPERIVPLRYVREVGGRLEFHGRGAAAARRSERARGGALLSRAAASARSASA